MRQMQLSLNCKNSQHPALSSRPSSYGFSSVYIEGYKETKDNQNLMTITKLSHVVNLMKITAERGSFRQFISRVVKSVPLLFHTPAEVDKNPTLRLRLSMVSFEVFGGVTKRHCFTSFVIMNKPQWSAGGP